MARTSWLAVRAPLLILTVLVLRVGIMRTYNAIPPHFYCDSSAHTFNAWLLAASGFSRGDLRSLNLAYLLYAAAIRCGADVLYAPWAVNFLLAALSVVLLFDAVRRLEGTPSALLAAMLGISVPAFSRLIFSGETEMTALCMATLAFWLSVRGRAFNENGRFLMDLAGVAALGMGFFARLETIGALALYLLVLAFIWWRRPGLLLAAALTGLLFAFLHYQWFGARLQAAYASNSSTWATDLRERLQRVPRWLAFNFFPLNLAALLALGVFRRRPWSSPLAALAAILIGQALLLYLGSCLYIGSSEIDRNMAAVCFLSMAPAAAVIGAAARRLTPPFKRGGLLMLAVLLARSWNSGLITPPSVPDTIGAARSIGFELRQAAAQGALGSTRPTILFETSDLAWEDVAVFSGMPGRLRLFPRTSEDSPENNWDGAGDFDVLVVRSKAQEARFKRRFASLRLIESFGDYRIYRKDPAPTGRPA